jgi:Mce-associated membrane protein
MAVDVDAPDRELSSSEELPEDNSSCHDDEITEQPRDRPDSHRAVLRLALAIGGLAAVALGCLTGWLGWQTYQAHSLQQLRESYLQAAREGALNLTTIDYKKVDGDIQRILHSSTAPFHDDFQQRSAPFIDAVKHAQSMSAGTVTAAGLESLGDNEAQVLLAVSVKTTIDGAPTQQPNAWRMRISIQKVGDEMKMSNVAFVP